MKKRYIVYMKIILIIVFLVIFFSYFKKNNFQYDNYKTSFYQENYSFFEYGITNKKTSLYVKIGGKYSKIGSVEANNNLYFSKLVGNYLLIKNLDDEYYVKINSVNRSDDIIENDVRYKNYILFNENIVTSDTTNFYSEDGELLYTFNKSFNLPIIVKDDDSYGVEYANQLLYVKKEDVVNIIKSENTTNNNASGVGVLNYHFFYDEQNLNEKNECNQVICLSKTKFQEQLDYLKKNNILTITTNELELYIDGKIKLPKSVLITIDDGYMMNNGLQVLEQNKMYGCVFLITSWFKSVDFFNSYKYIEFNSHGENLHNTGVCPGGQGGAIKCLARDKLLEDIKISRQKLHNCTSFAYPFYEYNDYSVNILKDSGISMAFVGEGASSDNLVHVGSDKYTLPRFVVVSYTTLNDIDNYLSRIN